MQTLQIGIGQSTARDHSKAAVEAINQAKVNLKTNKVDLAILFTTPDFAHPNALNTIADLLGNVNIIGSSSPALISDSGIMKYGLLIALLSIPEGTYLNSACIKQTESQSVSETGRQLAEKLLYGFKGIRKGLSVVFSNGLGSAGSEILLGLKEKLGASFPLTGASASDNLTPRKANLYFNHEIFEAAACGILWGGKFSFSLATKHGWKPLGKPRRITDSRANIINEIDGQPAAQIYEEYFAKNIPSLRNDLKRISKLYPIGIYLPGENEYILRNILAIDDYGSLTFQGNIIPGSTIRLMIGTKESCLEATFQAAEEVRKNAFGHKTNFILVFNSASRYILLGRQAYKEIEIMKKVFGKEVPIIGMYSYGEIAPLRSVNYLGGAYLHNQTITILAITS